MGVTSLGPHTRPGCNLGYCRDLFFVLNDVDLYTVCFSWTFGDARGLGLNCACVPFVTRLRAVHKTMPRMWCSFSYGVTWLWCPNMGIATSSWSRGLYAWFWLVEKNFAALWLVGTYCSLHYYFHFIAFGLSGLGIEGFFFVFRLAASFSILLLLT